MQEDKPSRGRPLKFQSVEELQTKIDAFFADCEAKEEPFTITGLALVLGTSRQCLINYQDREEFFDAIKTAKDRVENYAEKRLFTGQPTGPIFALKNFGWADSQNVNLGGQADNPVKSDVTVRFVD